MLPKRRFWRDRTKRCVCVFERIFNDSSPKSSTLTIVESNSKNARANALFGPPKSSFGEHTCSTRRCPNRVLTSLKSTAKTITQRFVQSFKIFVWGAYNRYKTDIAHRPVNRIGRCAMMHVVIFGPRGTKPISHIDWRNESDDVR